MSNNGITPLFVLERLLYELPTKNKNVLLNNKLFLNRGFWCTLCIQPKGKSTTA